MRLNNRLLATQTGLTIFDGHNSKMSHPRCVYMNNRCGYQSITQQYLKKMFNKG